MKLTVQRFGAYAKPSGEVCVRACGVWYGLGVYFERGVGLYADRRGFIVPGAMVVWRRHVEAKHEAAQGASV